MNRYDKRRGMWHTIVNLVIVGAICAIYMVMRQPQTLEVFSASATYKGSAGNDIALQCVVDWNASAVAPMLDTLSALNTQITFFVSGEWVRDNPELLMRMAREGHEIGTVGFYPSQDGKREWLVEDITAASAAIKSACGITVTMYHSGSRGVGESSSAASALGMKNVLCTIDLLCARGGKDDILSRAANAASGGNIIQITPTPAASEALAGIIFLYQDKGLNVVSTGRII